MLLTRFGATHEDKTNTILSPISDSLAFIHVCIQFLFEAETNE